MNKSLTTSRRYESEHDLLQIEEMLMQARWRTRPNDWRYAHVGELIFNFFMVQCHLNPQEHIRLWHDEEGALVGYAMLGEDPAFDWQVSPEYEWTGIEAQALAWAERRMKELRMQEAQRWGGNCVSAAARVPLQRRFCRGEYAAPVG